MKKRNKTNKFKLEKIYLIFIRYLFLLIIMFFLPFIYKILTPLTIYPVYFLLKLVYNQVLIQNTTLIIDFSKVIQLIPACIAGSAYLLLLILILTIEIKPLKRIYLLFYCCLTLLIANILRIFILIILYYSSNPFFDITHKIFWYFLSTIFVILIWFSAVKIFKIKTIPIYSDIIYIYKKTKKKAKN